MSRLAVPAVRRVEGEKARPRRDFIQKHALEVKDIDYHGA
jgi:hypothetical protein